MRVVRCQVVGASARCVVLLINGRPHPGQHVDCGYEARAASNHVGSHIAIVDGVNELRCLAVQQLAHVDEAIVPDTECYNF